MLFHQLHGLRQPFCENHSTLKNNSDWKFTSWGQFVFSVVCCLLTPQDELKVITAILAAATPTHAHDSFSPTVVQTAADEESGIAVA